jgi:hypothetical protein
MVHDWRDKYILAFTEDAAKPYTHMALHFAPCQRRVQHDLVRYSCQSQEHWGKIAKFIVRHRTNHQLGGNARRWHTVMVNGKRERKLLECTRVVGGEVVDQKGYVEQTVQQMAWRLYLRRHVPVKETGYSRKLKNQKEEEEDDQPISEIASNMHPEREPRLKKKTKWEDHKVASSELKAP